MQERPRIVIKLLPKEKRVITEKPVTSGVQGSSEQQVEKSPIETLGSLAVAEEKLVTTTDEAIVSMDIEDISPVTGDTQESNDSDLRLGTDHLVTDKHRSMTDYLRASKAKGHIFLGRRYELRRYRQMYDEESGRVLNPEGRGEDWKFKMNIAFMAGGIEAGKRFLIVTDLQNITNRASNQEVSKKEGLGGASYEILWLQDHGYTFVPDEKNPRFTWANPPITPIHVSSFGEYGLGEDRDSGYPIEKQIQRLEAISDEVLKLSRAHQSENAIRRPVFNTWGNRNTRSTTTSGLFSRRNSTSDTSRSEKRNEVEESRSSSNKRKRDERGSSKNNREEKRRRTDDTSRERLFSSSRERSIRENRTRRRDSDRRSGYSSSSRSSSRRG